MTDINDVRDRLIDLAATENADHETMATLSKDFLNDGASISALSELLIPRGWRFLLSQSGEKLELARIDDLRSRYQAELDELANWRSVAGDESWHEQISVDIHQLIAKHRELDRYLRPSESLR